MNNTIVSPLEEKLIYELLFDDTENHKIDLNMFITDELTFMPFLKDIKNILKKADIEISKSVVIVDGDKFIWELKLKK